MMFIIALWSFFAAISPLEEAHEIHISKCIIEYSNQDQAFQIMMHVYVDDLELALKAIDEEPLKLNTEHEYASADSIIMAYLDQTFKIKIDGELAVYDYIGKEASEDLQAVWIYLEIPNLTEVAQLEVTDSMLTELYDDQTNIIQIKSKGGKRAYFLLNREKASDSANF